MLVGQVDVATMLVMGMVMMVLLLLIMNGRKDPVVEIRGRSGRRKSAKNRKSQSESAPSRTVSIGIRIGFVPLQ